MAEEIYMEDTQLCYDCAFKHLAAAWVAWSEVHNGYREPGHIMKVVGHMSHAEEHLLERHKSVAESIREARKCWWDATLNHAIYRPRFEEWLALIWGWIQEDLVEERVVEQGVADITAEEDGKAAEALMDATFKSLDSDPDPDAEGRAVRTGFGIGERILKEARRGAGEPDGEEETSSE